MAKIERLISKGMVEITLGPEDNCKADEVLTLVRMLEKVEGYAKGASFGKHYVPIEHTEVIVAGLNKLNLGIPDENQAKLF